jgi:hypothetical protein
MHRVGYLYEDYQDARLLEHKVTWILLDVLLNRGHCLSTFIGSANRDVWPRYSKSVFFGGREMQ